MPWTPHDYPDSMKNLTQDVRLKAIDIANTLVQEGNEEGRSIAIGIAKAREAVYGDDSNRPKYEVKLRGDDWVFGKAQSNYVIFSEPTKEQLLRIVKPYVNEQNGILTIYEMDGSKERTLYA